MTNDRIPPPSEPRMPAAAAAAGALVVIVVAGLLSRLSDAAFGKANAALVLVMVVAGAAWLGGRSAGVLTAVVAAASFNFFLTRPFRSLKVADPTDIVTVVLLLVVGLAVGALARHRDLTARRLRAQETSTDRLERAARLLVTDSKHDELCAAIGRELVPLLGLSAAQWWASAEPTGLPVMGPTGWVDATVHRHGPNGFLLPASGVELPIEFAGARLGSFVLFPSAGDAGVSSDQRRVAVALGDLLGSALARSSMRVLPGDQR